ncbi:PAS domain S-box protein [Enterocloster clostridioformis]|uniref:PrpR N-terminal domain-containing protein n=1 Tax=Enterocloster clostridioformis TaxID=1531 RepID=UPI00080C384E|nr:PrpR N-terminal domain-containing protein [Enterocloster clostridioformis]ANU44597.1 PAS domain S-box protein [Lachnoclostridium sp. YL32]NDO28039.1 PAS domain S-box protein [Enterocloster clostridioformis]OXE70492.1 PAS domain S-box protein [Enterocloster clostridioformis]QQR00646.1 PrpR N-terminal domain-containing protein [Enterocloster clostridioformis]
MGKIVLLVPREEMLYLAHNILQEKKYAIAQMRVIQTENTAVEARNSIAAGADIIIARGLQASLIKQYTDVPVVEIVATAQEMALLVVKARQIVKKARPIIAVVGFQNMFCDMTYFETIYDIKLRTYFAANGSGLKEKAMEAVEDGADLMIGGDIAVETAKEADIPSLFLSITEDSLRTAFSMAESLDFAMGAEKRSNAQIETLLDYSFNGVVNMDRKGVITTVNPVMRDILGADGEQVAGRHITQVFSDIDRDKLSQVLEGKEESYSSFMQAGKTSIFAILAPVRVGNETEGAILTCHKVKQQSRGERRPQRDGANRVQGLIARRNFSSIRQESGAMKECVHLARLYSQSEQPVLLLGETGTERRALAESIHNTGLCSEGPFLALSCAGLAREEQEEMLFGNKGAVFLAEGGTLYLEDVETLSLKSQYGLYQLIRYKTGSRDFARTMGFHIRVIASSILTPEDLGHLAFSGGFRRDLYYLFTGLVLRVPPLRERPEDLEQAIRDTVREACDQYSRYHVVTQGGMQCLKAYPWQGNLLQLETFLKRLILTAEKRSIDEILVRKLLRELFPSSAPVRMMPDGQGIGGPVACEEERQIRLALAAQGGSRERAAACLGISKATLWRKMKKYNIEL